VMPSSETVTRSRGRSALDRDGTSPVGGSQPPSEAEFRPRGRPTLGRGETSPEGATDPRARRNLTRGGVRPSSEAELYWCGAVPLERSGVPPGGG
jgi:hypothetical protein